LNQLNLDWWVIISCELHQIVSNIKNNARTIVLFFLKKKKNLRPEPNPISPINLIVKQEIINNQQ
jgi:hypothetical protein